MDDVMEAGVAAMIDALIASADESGNPTDAGREAAKKIAAAVGEVAGGNGPVGEGRGGTREGRPSGKSFRAPE